jgi:hypothetical protein
VVIRSTKNLSDTHTFVCVSGSEGKDAVDEDVPLAKAVASQAAPGYKSLWGS